MGVTSRMKQSRGSIYTEIPAKDRGKRIKFENQKRESGLLSEMNYGKTPANAKKDFLFYQELPYDTIEDHYGMNTLENGIVAAHTNKSIMEPQ
jgi:hypothetical protein